MNAQTIIESVRTLQPLPQTAVKLAQILADKNASINDVVDVITLDQALTANVLRYANSANSSSRRKIGEVREAVIRLGGGRILKSIIAGHTRGMLKQALPVYGYEEGELWRHSIAAALASQLLGRYCSASMDGISFSAAILHDIGKLLIARHGDKQTLRELGEKIKRRDALPVEVEKEILGISHAHLGARIAEQWGLPDAIVKAVRDHNSVVGEPDGITDAVVISNIVARSIGEGLGYEGMCCLLDEELADRVEMTRKDFERLCLETRNRFHTTVELYEGN